MPISLPKTTGAGENACPTNVVSERKTRAELQGATRERRAGDLSNRRASDAAVRNAEAGVVERVKRVEAELKLAALQFRKRDDLCSREIDVRISRATQDVPSGVAVRILGRRNEGG